MRPPSRAPLVRTYQGAPVDDVVSERIRYFHKYLDSLQQNDVLRYDSLMKSRPHLLDSILTVEQFLNE